ncbi:hypothetical protein JOC78_001519 [Bacillus ectoiniformans]|nr:hypothetical protein [Bacillus ectoiniformans]
MFQLKKPATKSAGFFSYMRLIENTGIHSINHYLYMYIQKTR